MSGVHDDLAAKLSAGGIKGKDAETVLNRIIQLAIDRLIEDTQQYDPEAVVRVFGQDLGRAVLVLRR